MPKDPFTIFDKNPNVKDSLIKNYAAKKGEGESLDYYHNGSPLSLLISPKKIFILFAVFIIIFIAISTRIIYLQVIKGNYYLSLAEGNRIKQIRNKASRGIIYDCNHEPLVKNKANFLLNLIPGELSNQQEDQNKIASLLSNEPAIEYSDVLKKLNTQNGHQKLQNIVIKNNIPYEQAIKLLVETDNLKGVNISQTNQREYIYSPSLSHTLGYLGKINESEWPYYNQQGYGFTDQVGKSGLELYYENQLRGQDGIKEIEVDASGEVKKILKESEVSHGYNLILTINNELQNFLTTELQQAIQNNLYSNAGVGIVLNPNTGEILSLVSLPNYDSNIFSQGISQEDYNKIINNPYKPLFNRTISGEYPPGSTFKLIIGASAINENIIDITTGFNSTGGIQINKWFFPDWQTGGHGYTQITKALAESVNTFFYYIGGGYEEFDGLGVDKITSYAKLFGLNQPTGIDLPNEKSGFMPSKEWKLVNKNENWYVGDTYHLSIGQGDILVTPLQVACYTSIFANSGTLYKPYLVKAVEDAQNQTIKDTQPTIIKQNIVSQKSINTVRQGLREAVTYGSARSLGALNVTTAGKTGTAQVSGDQQPHAWFTAFAPYQDPEIVITILLENGGEGSDTALKVAKKVIDYYFNILAKQ